MELLGSAESPLVICGHKFKAQLVIFPPATFTSSEAGVQYIQATLPRVENLPGEFDGDRMPRQ